jgi:hypothetical protein
MRQALATLKALSSGLQPFIPSSGSSLRCRAPWPGVSGISFSNLVVHLRHFYRYAMKKLPVFACLRKLGENSVSGGHDANFARDVDSQRRGSDPRRGFARDAGPLADII